MHCYTAHVRNDGLGNLSIRDAWRSPSRVVVMKDPDLGTRHAVLRKNLEKLSTTHPHLVLDSKGMK